VTRDAQLADESNGRALAAPPAVRPETVEALLDTTWRLAAAEQARREGVNQKASSLATFASLILSVTATLGTRLIDRGDEWWVLALYLSSLASLIGAVALAILVLLPRAHLALGTAYLERFPEYSEVSKPPEQARGETMKGLVVSIRTLRELNDRNAIRVFVAFLLLLAGLGLVSVEAASVAIVEVR
jgi:hypothetical protein